MDIEQAIAGRRSVVGHPMKPAPAVPRRAALLRWVD
jgi:hypothetical protein